MEKWQLFIKQIESFQAGHDVSLISDILSQTYDDLDQHAVKGDDKFISKFNFPRTEMYIAYRIRNLRNKLFETIGFTTDEELDELNEGLFWFNKGLASQLGIKLLVSDHFTAFDKNKSHIRSYLGSGAYADLLDIITRSRRYLAEEAAQAHIDNDIVVPALHKALMSADLTRKTDDGDIERFVKGVVRYVNRVFQSEFIKLQQEKLGVKRIGRTSDERFHNVIVLPNYNETNVLRIIFGCDIPAQLSVEKLCAKLTKDQGELVGKICEIVSEDFGEQDRKKLATDYKVDTDGNFRIKIRYIAGKVGIEESNFRKRISRIKEKVLIS